MSAPDPKPDETQADEPSRAAVRRSLFAVPHAGPRRGTGFRGALDELLSTFPWSTTALVLGILSTALSLGFGFGLTWREDTWTERYQALRDAERGYIELIGKTRDENERRTLRSQLASTRVKLGEALRQMGLEDPREAPDSRVAPPPGDVALDDANASAVRAAIRAARGESSTGNSGTPGPRFPESAEGRVAVVVPQESPRPTVPRALPPLDLDLSPYLGPDLPEPSDPTPEESGPEDDAPALLSSTWGFARHTRFTLVAPPGLDEHHAELTGALMRFFPPRTGTFELPR